MRTCCACGASFAPTGKNYRCPPCRRAYDQQWRAKRSYEGKLTGGSRMPREYHAKAEGHEP
jgi:tRNA(Ile2) C34 agmatinyltransferase TiaS